MAGRRSATADPDSPVTLASEGLEDEAAVFPDSRGGQSGGLDDQPVAELVEDPAQPSPGAESGVTADGRAKTPEQLERENRNLRGALKQERGRKRSLLAEVDAQKRAREEAEGRAQDAERKRQAEVDLTRLDEAQDLKEAAPIIIKAARENLLPEIDLVQRRIIKQSQRIAELTHDDYHKTLEDSGLVDAITINPATGAPKDPDLWRQIYVLEEDPGEAAYQLAQELLARKNGREIAPGDTDIIDANEPAGDRATGRRDVVNQLRKVADRPTGIRNLSAAPAPMSRRYTRRQIDSMSDEQRERLPVEVIEEWLSGSP